MGKDQQRSCHLVPDPRHRQIIFACNNIAQWPIIWRVKKVPHAFRAFVMQILSPPRVTTNSLAPLTKHPPSHHHICSITFMYIRIIYMYMLLLQWATVIKNRTTYMVTIVI